jgi:hypothetical protein
LEAHTGASASPGPLPFRNGLYHAERHEGTGSGGSGLGLAILKTIATRHRVQMARHDREHGSGLRVRLILPRVCVSPATHPWMIFSMPVAVKLVLRLTVYTVC